MDEPESESLSRRFYLETLQQWIQLRSRVETVWHARWLGLTFIGVSVLVAFWWYFHLPSPGYAVTVMSVVAVLMALRTKMDGRERFLWAALSIAFAVVEIHAIRFDRSNQDHLQAANQNELECNFRKIGKGITESVDASKDQFASIMTRFDLTAQALSLQNRNLTALYNRPVGISESSGNLRDRALRLSTEIVAGMEKHDRANLTQSPSEQADKSSAFFRFEYLPQVMALGEDLARVNIRDKWLDAFIASERAYKKNKETFPGFPNMPISFEIRKVAETLSNLAAIIKK